MLRLLILCLLAVGTHSLLNFTTKAVRHVRSRHKRMEDGRPYLLVGDARPDSGPWSGWRQVAPCSRTCGGGVLQEERQCTVPGACTGAPKRYFSCNIEECPPGSEDFRTEQCALYNNVDFEGHSYEWVPYRKAANKCQLNCMPRGERFYYRHQDKVIDGTPCTEDSLDVCIDGECVEVGCDRLLGSRLKEDACRVCGGDGSSCSTSSGTIDTNDLVSGYNDMLLIPEGATNIKVTERNPSSNYLAIRNKTGHYYLNGNWRIDFPRSLRFAGTVFTYSRKPFGFWAPESITALGPTTEAIYIVLLYQERNPGIDYIYSIPKGTVHETSPQGYGWKYGEWAPCNTTCGNGYQQREVWCALRKDSSHVSSDLCDPSTEPAWAQPCSLPACPPVWSTTPWSPCSVSCGSNGTQTRQVYCVQDDGSGRPTLVKDDAACEQIGHKPPTSQSCQGPPVCPSWHLGPWKPCDRLCGPGYMRRELHCFQKGEDGRIELFENNNCGGEMPENKKSCNLRPCEGLDWITSDWSGCAEKCGLAFETRTAFCGNQEGEPYPDDLCHDYRKPELVRNCSYTPCASQWYSSQWSACSAKCGSGVQTRSVFCAMFEGDLLKKVPDSNCDPDQKYADKQECTVEAKCKGEWFYGPFSSCSKPCGGGMMLRKRLCVKNNESVSINECDSSIIETTAQACNQQPCGEDEIIPVDPTQVITEEYSEECEEDYDYDYGIDFIKVPGKLDSSTLESLILDEDLLNTTHTSTDEDEGSGGFSEDFMTIRSSDISSPQGSTEGLSPLSFSSSEISIVSASSLSLSSDSTTEASYDSSTLSGLFSALYSSSSSIFDSTLSSLGLSLSPSPPSNDSSSLSGSNTLSTQDFTSSEESTIATNIASESGSISNTGLSSDSSIGTSSVEVSSSSSTADSLLRESSPTGTNILLTSSDLPSMLETSSPVSSSSSSHEVSSSSHTTLLTGYSSFDISSTDVSSTSVTGSTDITSNSDTASTDVTSPSDTTSIDVSSPSDTTSTDVSSPSDTTSTDVSSPDTTSTDVSSPGTTSTDISSDVSSPSDFTSSSDAPSSSDTTSPSGISSPTLSSSESSVVSSDLTSISADSSSDSYMTSESIVYDTTSHATSLEYSTSVSLSSSGSTHSSLSTDSSSDLASTGDLTTVSHLSTEGIATFSSSSTDSSVTDLTISTPEDSSSSDAEATSESTTSSDHISSSSGVEQTSSLSSTEDILSQTSLSTQVSEISSSESSSTEISTFRATGQSSEDTSTSSLDFSDRTSESSSYSEVIFGVTTPRIDSAVTKEQKIKQCKRRPRKRKCMKSEFGCCPDNKTPAKGPFGKDCPIPKTCLESEFGCCPDEVSPAKGPLKRGCPPTFCEQTLFGCCQDKITPALGNDFEGCPVEITTFIPDCSSSEFGCCPDGILSAQGPDQEGCASCNQTEFGCCTDGLTAASGPENFGCDEFASTTTSEPEVTENITSLCDNSTFGCCPDGDTVALGPNNFGCSCTNSEFGCCPDGETKATGPNDGGCQPDCAAGEFGCCSDNVTMAHGPNMEGCCLLSLYGCCPDNILPARGPNLEGCGCIYSPYGCCPDNQTAARGPELEGCGCQYTPHGCCPNNYNPAAGPDFQGCPCHTFQFGCCPDGITTAIGPHLQGCGCEDSEFGCCSDGRTPAPDSSKNCSCAASKYGCCLDGVTEAQGDDFEACSTKLIYKGEHCSLGKQLGECRNLTIKWYFDMQYGGCSRFWYGGCGGNGNRFSTADECKETCVEAKGKDRCYLPKIEGPCKSYYPRWYYNKERKVCSQFIYSGCLGNTNRFETREECEQQCGSQLHLDPCDQKVDRGPCDGNYSRWYFDKEAQVCSQFEYGGCKGSQNNFLSESACRIKCLQPGKSRELDVCMQPALEGNCHNYTERYFFDVLRKTCRLFYYGGCGGNHNNFHTELECRQRCDPQSVPTQAFDKQMCFLASDAGSCSGSDIKWFYNSQDGICKQFRYTGCGGNGNRFETRNDCEYSCSDVQDVCKLPRVVGPCNANLRQWHYDAASRTCQAFDYGGCQGNGNRFDSEEECRRQCVKETPPPTLPGPQDVQDICYLSMDPGPCLQQIPAWAYNPVSGSCQQFNFGGCEGNANRFASEEQCERQCGQFRGQDSCTGEMDVGQCDDFSEKFYFDHISKTCAPFAYTGCGGNPNRFSTLQECESVCQVYVEPPLYYTDRSPAVSQAICSLPMEAGPCSQGIRRWYYEPRRQSCTPFIYTGCAGNLNNFLTFQECSDFCLSSSPTTPHDVDEGKSKCEETERRCQAVVGCRYGIERWVDSSGCTACHCHEPCLTSPLECPPNHSCQVTLRANPQTGIPEYRAVCAPDLKPGECPSGLRGKSCNQECRGDNDCPGELKCCYTGCGTMCSEPQQPTTPQPHTQEPTVEAPFISNETPSEESSPEGSYVTFNCIAHGRPRPRVAWYRAGTQLDQSSGGRYRLLENGTLQVIGLERSDYGIYNCRASNGILPDASRDYNLTVTVPVFANIDSTTKTINQGNNITLTCSVSGYPTPRISWYWNGAPLDNRPRIVIEGDKLSIYDTRVEDSGEYRCIADNGYSTAQASVTLHVQGIYISPDCTDSPFLANCKLIIKAGYCNHKFYAKFCCKSCTEAGQLPPNEGPSSNFVRRRRFAPERLLRIPSL